MRPASLFRCLGAAVRRCTLPLLRAYGVTVARPPPPAPVAACRAVLCRAPPPARDRCPGRGHDAGPVPFRLLAFPGVRGRPGASDGHPVRQGPHPCEPIGAWRAPASSVVFARVHGVRGVSRVSHVLVRAAAMAAVRSCITTPVALNPRLGVRDLRPPPPITELHDCAERGEVFPPHHHCQRV
jgi:hypothetical protein